MIALVNTKRFGINPNAKIDLGNGISVGVNLGGDAEENNESGKSKKKKKVKKLKAKKGHALRADSDTIDE